MIALRTAACCAGITLALCVAVTQAHASTVSKAPVPSLPQGPCDQDHVLDWELINGVLYECACDHMIFGPPVCEWQEITSQAEDPVRYRKLLKRIKAKRWHLVVRVAKPTVIVPVAATVALVAKPIPASQASSKCNDPYLADDAWAQTHGC